MSLSALACFRLCTALFTRQTVIFFCRMKRLITKNDKSKTLWQHNAHYAYFCHRHHDRAVTGLWFASLHDEKRGPRQISQRKSLSLSAWQRTLLGWASVTRFSRTRGGAQAVHTTDTHASPATRNCRDAIDGRRVRITM